MIDVGTWLASLGLSQYAAAFEEQQVDGDLLASLSDDDLRELGVAALGHRKRLLLAIARLGETGTESPRAVPPGNSPAPTAQATPHAKLSASRQGSAGTAGGGMAPDRSAFEIGPASARPAASSGPALTTAAAGASSSGGAPAPGSSAPMATDAERRHLTVMFCDLVDSTSLAGRLDPEEYQQLVSAYHRSVADCVATYEGHIAQFLGDGVLVYFGFPRAHEDDAGRAMRAGLAVLDAVARLRLPGNRQLQTRIGVASGLVVVGQIGAGTSAAEVSASGETPNLAARLEALALPGTMVVCRNTRRLAGGAFETRDLGLHVLKGYGQPVPAWQVLGLSGVESRFEARQASGVSALVGREDELSVLLRRWERAQAGQGQAVHISGEAGVGKSRIVAGMEERLEGVELTWLRLFCSPYHGGSPLHPFAVQLAREAELSAADDVELRRSRLHRLLAAAGRRAPEDLALMGELLGMPDLAEQAQLRGGPRERKARTLEVLSALLGAHAQRRPTLVLIEDVHWADPTSLELLDLLIERCPRLPMLLVITSRPEFSSAWTGRAQVTTMVLNRLGQDDAMGIVQRVTGGRTMPPELLREILLRTDGVPLFVEELTRAVLESGIVRERPGSLELTGPLSGLSVPQTLQASLVARLDGLGPAKAVAQIASAIGREFDYRLLAAVSGIVEPELGSLLQAFIRSGLASQRGQGGDAVFIFKHALVQDAAYDSLLKSRRLELHRRIAQTLGSGLFEDAGPELVAHHYGLAAMPDRAVPLLLTAATRAIGRASYSEARAHCARALELLEPLPDTPDKQAGMLQARLHLGEALFRSGDVTEAMAAFEQSAAMAIALGDREALASAATGFADANWRPGIAHSRPLKLLRHADRELGHEPSALKARVLAWLAVTCDIARMGQEADDADLQAQAMAESLGDPGLAVGITSRRFSTGLLRLDGQAEALTRVHAAMRSAREAGNTERWAELAINTNPNLALLGDMAGLRAQLDGITEFVEAAPQPFHRYLLLSCRAAQAFHQGRFDEAQGLAQQSLQAGQGLAGIDPNGPFSVQMFHLSRESGGLPALAPLLRQFLKDTPSDSVWRPGLALMLTEIGEVDAARAEFEAIAEQNFASLPEDASWLNAVALLAEVCHRLADAPRAQALYQRLLPFETCNVIAPPLVVLHGATARYLGLLAATQGRWDAAEAHFRRGIELDEARGGRPWAAHGRHEWAQMLERRAQTGDLDRARELNDQALHSAEALGMKALAERAQRLGEKLGPT